MNYLSLVFVNLGRNKRRTILTLLSVTVAVFLFCLLGSVLDTLEDSIKVGSQSRLVTRNKVSLIFPMPLSYQERIRAIPGVKQTCIQNWFGGTDPKNPRNFFAQFAVTPEFYEIYGREFDLIEYSQPQVASTNPELDPRLAAYMQEQTACIVGRKLMEKMGWKLGQTVTVGGTIYPGDWPVTIRAVYVPKKKSFGEETMFFHYKYLEQKGMGGQGQAGIYVLDLAPGIDAATVGKTVDAQFENSAAQTLTESEQAFQAGFVSMYGNVPFVLRIIGLAVVFAILLIAANTMVMAVRERTSEIGVMKTLGFTDGTVFGLVLTEAAVITLGGGLLGAALAWFAVNGGMQLAFLPLVIYWRTVVIGIAVALAVGAVSGIIPAMRASRLRIVDALRRVD